MDGPNDRGPFLVVKQATLFLFVPGFQPMSSVTLDMFVTHLPTVADMLGLYAWERHTTPKKQTKKTKPPQCVYVVILCGNSEKEMLI